VIVSPQRDQAVSQCVADLEFPRCRFYRSGPVADGGLASVSANFPLLYEYAAVYVDKILKGANPASLPVEQPSKFQVTLNSKTAQELGLSLSPILLAQIDEVIE